MASQDWESARRCDTETPMMPAKGYQDPATDRGSDDEPEPKRYDAGHYKP